MFYISLEDNMNVDFAVVAFRSIRDRIRAEDPAIDEQTLADTVEGLTDLHEIIAAIIRSALSDEALATGLKCRIADMQGRLDRLQDRASKRRQIAKDVMVELDLKMITAPDFTVSIRPGMPALLVLDEAAPSPDPFPAQIDKSVLAIAEPKRIRDKEHLRFVALQPCLICGRQPSDPHHLRFAQLRALGLKVSD